MSWPSTNLTITTSGLRSPSMMFLRKGLSPERMESNERASESCLNGGVCADLVNDYAFDCPTGFEAKICQVNIDKCAVKPCKNGGECTDGINSRTCKCQRG